MKAKAISLLRPLADSFLYVLLFLLCIAAATVLFTLIGLPGLAAPGAATLGVYALYRITKHRRVDIKERFSLKPLTARDITLIVAVAVPVTLLVQSVQFIVPPQYLTEAPQFEMQYGAFSVFTTVIASPIAEEIFFRGFIFKRLCASYHPAIAVLIASFMFSGMHPGELWSFMAMLISVFYSVLFLKYKSVYAPITAHITSNFIAVCFNFMFN
ncbi:MAG: CPBP family intramembrane metalloprotease [Defluviitaleaceae bacterium]|nr:CPBP family intramembrane metalloprotease [Defluviitaleaceae bacterium]